MPIGATANGDDKQTFYGKLYGYMSGLCGSGIIKNMKIANWAENMQYRVAGLFTSLGDGAVLKNIGLENYEINSDALFIGLLVGYVNMDERSTCTIENCYTIGNLTCYANIIGGIIGVM